MFVWALRDKGSEWRAVAHFTKMGRLPFTPYLARPGKEPKNPVSVLRKLGEKVWVDLGNLVGHFTANDVAEFHNLVRENIGLVSHKVTPVIRASSPGQNN